MPQTALTVLDDTKPLQNHRRHTPIAERRAWQVRVREALRATYDPVVAELAITYVDGVVEGSLPTQTAKVLLQRLLPALSADLSELPAELATAQDWLDTLRGLHLMRRQNRLSDEQWLNLIRAVNESWRSMQEARALIKVGR